MGARQQRFGLSEKEHGLLRLSKRACSPLIKPQSAPCPRGVVSHIIRILINPTIIQSFNPQLNYAFLNYGILVVRVYKLIDPQQHIWIVGAF